MKEYDLAALAATTDKELAAAITSPDGRRLVDAAFDQLPQMFRPEEAGGLSVVVHWVLSGDRLYEAVIENNRCMVSRVPCHEPQLIMTMASITFIRMVSGRDNPMKLFHDGED